MPYSYSDQERDNLKWFANDCTRQSLKAISITRGQLRGLSKFRIGLTYPISAIAGKNGSGKSSILALAACAFHNRGTGWKLPDRKYPYYTFSDFFIQAAEDVPLDGISISYEIAHDKWKPNERLPDGIGLGLQVRKKNKGGKWNDYDKRVPRCVAFLGIERVVPPAERSVYKSYRYSFSSSAKSGWEGRVRESVSRVLGIAYEDFEIKSHGKYRLPLVKRNSSARYSGFNMGAGEKALFELFATIYAAPDGTLFLVDELELGLHESAQGRLVKELNEVCRTRKIQVICTTHSPRVLAALPPEGRFLIQAGDTTQVLTGVSPEFAAGNLAEINSGELKIFVEDEVAATLVEAALEHSISQRVCIIQIGPHSAVVHQMAAHFLEDSNCKDCVAFLDGDQSILVEAHRKQFVGWVGKGSAADASKWIESRLKFLPDNTAPELWVLKELASLSDDNLLDCFHISNVSRVRDALNTSILTKPHEQVHTLARTLGLNERYAWRDCCTSLKRHKQQLFEPIIKAIQALLQ